MPIVVRLEQRETGQQTPIEDWRGTVVGWTRKNAGERYYGYNMSLEEFNQRAPDLFRANRPPGFEYIPQIIVTADEAKADDRDEQIALLTLGIEALKAENDRLNGQNEALTNLLASHSKDAPVHQMIENETPLSHLECVPPPSCETTTTKDLAVSIDEALAEKNYRVPELALRLAVSVDELTDYIQSPSSPFERNAQAWVKRKAA